MVLAGFKLRAARRSRARRARRRPPRGPGPGPAARRGLRPAARGRAAGTEPLLGRATSGAEVAGVRPGMRMGEALGTCPEIVLVEPDPAAAEQEWEGVLRRLEDAGFPVESASLGCA